MKKLLYITFVIIPILFTSCEMEPSARFTVSNSVVYVGEAVYFTNQSWDADFFEWDFGDATYSTVTHPEHAYTRPGLYSVRLAAYNEENVDYTFRTIEVINRIVVQPEATLEVTVLEYYEEYPVPGASVILYGSLDDWQNERNPIIEGFTNNYGVVVFTGLFPKTYYLDVWEDHHDNYGLADTDIAYIKTMPLVPDAINTFTAWVDYVDRKNLKSGNVHQSRRK